MFKEKDLFTARILGWIGCSCAPRKAVALARPRDLSQLKCKSCGQKIPWLGREGAIKKKEADYCGRTKTQLSHPGLTEIWFRVTWGENMAARAPV